MRVALIAFGTRGDVQPLIVLAAGLRRRAIWCTEVVIATHSCFGSLVQSIAIDLPDLDSPESASVAKFVAVDSPPVLWKGLTGSDVVEASATRAQEDGCLEACREAGLIIFNMFALETYHVAEKMQVPCAVCHPYLPATPMPASFPGKMRRAYPQLFRRLIRDPDATESKRPPSSENSSGSSPDAAPRPSASVQKPTTVGGVLPAQSIAEHNSRGEPAWVHVEHWIWPLFTDKWAPFRERLGLHPCPLAYPEVVPSEFSVTTFDKAIGHSITTPPETPAVDRTRLPLVLYLFSPLVVDTSPFWPSGVRVCGYIFNPFTVAEAPGKIDHSATGKDRRAQDTSHPQSRCDQNDGPETADCRPSRVVDTAVPGPATVRRLPDYVEVFLSSSEDRPLYLGFGSMWSVCPPGYGLAFAVRAMLLGARQASRRCLIVLPEEEEIGFGRVAGGMTTGMVGDAARKSELDIAGEFLRDEFASSVGRNDLMVGGRASFVDVERGTEWELAVPLKVHRGLLAHDLLLPRCSLAVHHGGSGTTAAVLRAGIPHVVCPQQLDQFFWAERVRHLALGGVMERSLFVGHESSPNAPPASLICKAASTILSALTPQVRLRAACLGVKIRAEDGLQKVLDTLSLYSRSRRSTRDGAALADTASSLLRNPALVRGTGDGEPCTQQPWSENRDISAGVIHRTTGKVAVDRTPSAAFSKEGGIDEKALVLREMPNGVSIWCGGRAEEEVFFIYGEVFEDRAYARKGVRVQDGDTVWDVGANVGLASIFFELETDAPDTLNLYAFEPIPLNRVALERNLFEHCPRALVLGYALGARNEDGATATFYPRMPGNSTFRPLEKERRQGKWMKLGDRGALEKQSNLNGGSSSEALRNGFFDDVEQNFDAFRCISMTDSVFPKTKVSLSTDSAVPQTVLSALSSIVVKHQQFGLGNVTWTHRQVLCDVRTVSWAMANLGVDKIDLLKVDVEGVELDVLAGVRQEDWPKIRQVVVEVHPVGDRVSRTCALLRDQGFDVTGQALALDGTPLSPMASPQQSMPCAHTGDGPFSLPASNATDCSNGEFDEVADGMVYMVYATRCSG